jgi:hypothetical protein
VNPTATTGGVAALVGRVPAAAAAPGGPTVAPPDLRVAAAPGEPAGNGG